MLLEAEPGGALPDTSDEAWLRAMLRAEAALASAQARAGLVPVEHAAAIGAVCARARVPTADVMAAMGQSGSPAEPLARWLRDEVGEPAARSVHRGATSQDIVDTATMLLAGDALQAIVARLSAAANRAAELAYRHRDTPMVGRTLLQPAVPITFGFKAAVWMNCLDAAATGLRRVKAERLAVQLGGPAGTLVLFRDAGPDVRRTMAELLGLADAPVVWHTDRTRVAELAGALGTACGAVAKVARDVTLLAQAEVGEAGEAPAEEGTGVSSAMPHKRNPIAAVTALGAAGVAPGLVSTLLASMAHEHERAAGAWHAEWLPLRILLRATANAALALQASLDRLVVDPTRMRRNLDAWDGVLASDLVADGLSAKVGAAPARQLAAELAQQAVRSSRSLAEVMAADPRVTQHFTAVDIHALLDPAVPIRSAAEAVDRALAARRQAWP